MKPTSSEKLSKKPFKVGQRVCIITDQHRWGTITKVVDRNLNSRVKVRGIRRWGCYVLWDGAKKESYHLAKYLYREGEGNGFWGIAREPKGSE